MCPYLFVPRGFAPPEQMHLQQMHSQPTRGCWSLCSAPAPLQPHSPWPRGCFAASCGCCRDHAGVPASACPAAGALLEAPGSSWGAAGGHSSTGLGVPPRSAARLPAPATAKPGRCTPSALGDAGSSSVVPHKEFLSLLLLYGSHDPAKKAFCQFYERVPPLSSATDAYVCLTLVRLQPCRLLGLPSPLPSWPLRCSLKPAVILLPSSTQSS